MIHCRSALSSTQVVRVSEVHDQIDMPSLLAALPTDDREAGYLISHGADHIIGSPRECLLKHFNALRDFYLDAAKRHLLVALRRD